MIQPARVLPSNAPPLPDADNVHSSRVLQEHSGNGQYSNYSYVNNADQKYPASLLNENAYSGHQVPQPQHVYQQSAIQRRQYRQAQSRYGGMGMDDQARVAATARNLYNRFRASDHYMKYRNRQHKDDKNGQADQKWPDRLEVAFFQALVRWPPMGRRKMPHKDKLRGRNELIADYIEELTGEARTRKQVSSHIQVLKPFVEGDPYIMKWLSKHDLCGPESRCLGVRASSYHDGRRASAYHVGSQHIPAAPVMSSKDTNYIKESKALLEVFEPTNFQMFVQRKYLDSNNEEIIDRLHTYTKSITNPRQKEEQSPDWQSFGHDFPLLARINQQRPLDCNVLLADASLAFPTKSFKDAENKALPGVELGISFLCSSRHLPVNARVVCLNNFFRNGQILKEHCGRVEVHLAESEQPQTVDTQLKFGSTFWAKTLGTLASAAHQHADGVTDPDAPLKEQVKGITATQEVAVQTDTGYERLLVICWNFRLSSAECGRAYWRPLRLPPSNLSDEYSDPHHIKSERIDSVYDGYNNTLSYTDAGASSHPYITTSQPALQSPFEYDSSSGPASALTSATWPSIDEHTANTGPSQNAIDGGGLYDDNAFDFSGGNINISYDPSLVDFSTFDSSAFNFDMDVVDATTNTADFSATDPALQDYSQSDFSAAPWDASYNDSFVDSQLSAGASSFCTAANDGQSQGVFDYGGGGGGQQQYGPASTSYDDGSVGPVEGQAYEGAASSSVVKDEGEHHADALASVLTGLPSRCAGEQYRGLPAQ